MSNFFHSQWRDVAGNVKFWVLTVVLGGLMTGFTILTHGLKWWQQAGVIALYSVIFIWAITATALLRKRPETGIATSQGPSSTTTGQFQDVDAFYKTYDNAMLIECETNIRKESDQYQSGADRERFLIRLFASGVLLFIFEQMWAYIFRSQIRALEELNRHPLPISGVRSFYDEAAIQNPLTYQNYSFDSWLGFMRNYLMFVQQGETLSITVRGREFLKYLVHNGRSANDRTL